jgi:hypothetical protein
LPVAVQGDGPKKRDCESLIARGVIICDGVFIADEVEVDPGKQVLPFIRDGE